MIPPCPVCRTNKHANARAGGDFYCSKCGGLYDSDPNEGGDYSDRNSAVRIEREERRQERDRERRARR
jgi:hypothetical protein